MPVLTVESKAVAAVDLGVDTDHVGDVGRLHEDLIQDLLARVVELV